MHPIEKFAQEMKEKIENSQTYHILRCPYCWGHSKLRKKCVACEGRGWIAYIFRPSGLKHWDELKICEIPKEKINQILKLKLEDLLCC